MTNVLILGASGQIARHAIEMLAGEDDVRLTLFARNTARLAGVSANASMVQGDVLDAAQLGAAIKGQDIVYANLTGEDLDAQANSVIAAMEAEGVNRLIFVLSLGIYDEVPGTFGEWNNATIGEDLKPFRRAADAIEASGLDYTIVRPAWLTDDNEVDYELTRREEPFKGTVVSRKSVADLIVKVIRSPDLHLRGNVGVNKPGTDGDKPYFM
ncbi:SDR family oxidoreductase [Camelimonas sp. ID_303_24]